MADRKSIDCRDYPSEKNCSLKMAGAEDEVLDAAVQHAVSVHGHQNSPELREQIKSMLKDEKD
jgi:predicted small metal-binding protein